MAEMRTASAVPHPPPATASPRHLSILLLLLQERAHSKPAKISTTALASKLHISQQTASRWLIELENGGEIARTREGIAITKAGLDSLKGVYSSLASAFSSASVIEMRGKLFTGLKEGKYYMSQEGYRKQFEQKLGFLPYAGTLNLRLTESKDRIVLEPSRGTRINEFDNGARVFGALNAYPCIINNKLTGAVIVPDRTHYGGDTIEIIAKPYLRKALGLKDGDEVKVKVKLS